MSRFYKVDEYGVHNYGVVWVTFSIAAIMTSIILVSAWLLLYVESGHPDANIKLYGDAVWLLVMAKSTIGFGDFYPVTGLGRSIVTVVAIAGIGLFSYLASLFALKITGRTNTEIKNRELRKQNADILIASKENNKQNAEIIRTNIIAVDTNLEIIKMLKEMKS